jgi:hypothetical protein
MRDQSINLVWWESGWTKTNEPKILTKSAKTWHPESIKFINLLEQEQEQLEQQQPWLVMLVLEVAAVLVGCFPLLQATSWY